MQNTGKARQQEAVCAARTFKVSLRRSRLQHTNRTKLLGLRIWKMAGVTSDGSISAVPRQCTPKLPSMVFHSSVPVSRDTLAKQSTQRMTATIGSIHGCLRPVNKA